MKRRTLALGLLAAMLLPVLASCGGTGQTVAAEPTLPPVLDTANVTAEGRLEPIRYVDIAPLTDGIASEVLFAEGSRVEAGDVIAVIDNGQAKSLETARSNAAQELSAAYEAERKAQNDLDAYPLPREFVGMTAEQAARTWLEKLETARANFAPYADLSRKSYRLNRRLLGLPPKVLMDTGEFEGEAKEYKKQVDIGWVYYRRACTWLELESKLASAKARMDQAQRESDSLQDASYSTDTAGARGALASAEIRSPFAGTITKLDLKAGEVVRGGTPVATIGDLSGWVVRTTNLTEIDVVNIRRDQQVSVAFDAFPNRKFRGIVTEIPQAYGERHGDVVYEVTVRLTDIDPGMRWGLTAQVTFLQ